VIWQGGGSVVSGEPESARILSIDVGSSSVRAELYDDSGNNIEGTEVKLDYDFDYTADGGATQDADEPSPEPETRRSQVWR
jgi:glycerol kinase